jgi:DNA-binding beta-propeller fold protein YncE
VKSTDDRETAPGSKQFVLAFLAVVVATCILAVAAPAGALGFGPLSSFGSEGEAAGQTRDPGGLAIGADGSVYVADFLDNRVDVFSATGTFLRAFGRGVNPLDGSDVCTVGSGCRKGLVAGAGGSIALPEDVAIGPDGLLYVSAEPNERINVFTQAGVFVRAFGKGVNAADGSDVCTTACQAGAVGGQAGAMDGPGGLDFGAAGLLYVADRDNNRIDVFTPAGTFVRAFGVDVGGADQNVCTTTCIPGRVSDTAGAMRSPLDVKSGPDGQLAVSDRDNARIDIFTSNGSFVRAFGKEVNASDSTDVCSGAEGSFCRGAASNGSAGAFNRLGQLAVGAGGRILVADSENNRVSEFGFDGSLIRTFGEGVLNGASAFQVCSRLTGCQAGGERPVLGSTPTPFGVAVDAKGTIYVAEDGAHVGRIDSFGEPEPAKPPAMKPSNRFRFGKLALNRRKGTATLIVTVPGPGTLVLKGKGVHKAAATARGAGSVKLPITLTGKAKGRLAKTGKAKVKAQATFAPTGGSPLTLAKTLALKKILR